MRLAFPIDAFKLGPGQEHLAAHFEPFGPPLATQSEGDGADGAHVGRHIVAADAIAACHGLGQLPVFVNQRDRCAVILQLGHHLERLAERSRHAVVKLPHFLFGIRVAQRKHRVLVCHLREALREVAADTLRRRIGVGQLRVRSLELLQLVHHLVVSTIRDRRRGKHVISMVMPIQLIPQQRDSVLYIVHDLLKNLCWTQK